MKSSPRQTKALRRTKLLAISSGGGHWVQLLRLRPAFVDCDVVFVTVDAGYSSDVPGCQFRTIPDATRWNKLALVRTIVAVLSLMVRERPDIVVSTGAAPGYFGVRIGRLLGARTAWIDSVANVEELSLSGQRAGRCVDLWLTQWPHLARDGGPACYGSVL